MNQPLYFYRLLVCALCGCALWFALPRALQADEPPTGRLELIGRLGGPALAVAAQGQYAYIGHSFEFAVLDLRDPANPTRLAWLPISANDIVVEGNYAYVAGRDGLSIVEITHSTRPMRVGSLPAAVTVSSLALAGDYLYWVDGLGGFTIVNITQPTRPVKISQQRIDQRAEAVAVVGQRAYVATYTGLLVLDIAEPAHPRRLGSIAQPGWSQNVAVRGDYAYVSTMQGVAIVHISDPTQPMQVGLLPMAEYADGLQLVGDELWVANARQGLRVYNVTQPAHPWLLSVTPLPGALLDMAVAKDFALLTDVTTGNVAVVALDNPANPQLLGTYHAPGMSTGVAVQGNYAYVAADTAGDLHIVKVADPAYPVESDFYQTHLTSRTVEVQDNLIFAFDAAGASETIKLHNRLLVAPTGAAGSQPASLKLTDHITAPIRKVMGEAPIADVVKQNDYVYLAVGNQGIRVVDVSNPALPILVAAAETPDRAQSLAVVDDKVFVADGFGGLLVFRIYD